MAMQLTNEALDFLKSHGELYGDVADVLDVKPISLPVILYRNNRRLTELPVLKLISKAMNKDINELVEETEVEA